MKLRLTVHFVPEEEGLVLKAVGSRKAFGAWDPLHAPELWNRGSGKWIVDLDVPPGPLKFKVTGSTELMHRDHCHQLQSLCPEVEMLTGSPAIFYLHCCIFVLFERTITSAQIIAQTPSGKVYAEKGMRRLEVPSGRLAESMPFTFFNVSCVWGVPGKAVMNAARLPPEGRQGTGSIYLFVPIMPARLGRAAHFTKL